MNDAERVEAALRHLQIGIKHALDALAGDGKPEPEGRWAAVLAEIPAAGITLWELRQLLVANGVDARSIGGMVRLGRLRPDPGNLPGDRQNRYYLPGRTIFEKTG